MRRFWLGSLGTAGQGSTGDEGGKWFALYASADPSIVQDPADPNNNQCVRITGGQSMLARYSLAAPIATGTPFILSQFQGVGFGKYAPATVFTSEKQWTYYRKPDVIVNMVTPPDKDGFVQVAFVVEGNAAHARQVKTGVQGESHIEILEGLTEGELVVTGSYRAISKDLENGALVAISKNPSKSEPPKATAQRD